MKIGIVTFEFPNLSKNGGIGTAYGRLVDVLNEQGHEITIYFVDINQMFKNHETLQSSSLKIKRTVELRIVSIDESTFRNHTWAIARSVAVFNKIKNEEFDFLHFHDCMGFSWAASTIQKLGLGFQKTKIVLGMHGPNYWVNWAHNRNITDPVQIQDYEIEKYAYENANMVVSPSQYLIDFLKFHGWQCKSAPQVIPNCTVFVEKADRSGKAQKRIRQFIFFGRLEPRKGVQLFTKAVANFFLHTDKSLIREMKIVYLGKDRELNDGRSSKEYIQTELAPLLNQGLRVDIITHFDSKQCKEFFEIHKDALIVLPSLADNSPYAVVECLEQSLNFICSNVGGQCELISPEFWESHTFSPTVSDLIEKFILHTTQTLPVPRPSQELLSSNSNWIQFHQKRSVAQRQIRLGITYDILVKAGSEIEDLELTINNLLKVRSFKKIFVYISNKDFAKWTAVEIKKIEKLAKKNHDRLRTNLVFSGWHQEIFIHFQKQSKSTFCLCLNAGEVITKEGAHALENINPQSTDLLLFGYKVDEINITPPPVCLANDIFYDSLCKFPAVFSFSAIKDIISPNFESLTNEMSLSTPFILMATIRSKNIESVPIVLVESKRRLPYYPYWLTTEMVFASRLKTIKGLLFQPNVTKLKTAYNLKKKKIQEQRNS